VSLDTWSLVALAVFALLGFWRGAARQLASLVALICASIASRPLSEAIGPWWAQKQPALSLSTAVFLSFVLSFILLSLIAYALVLRSVRPQPREPAEPKQTPSRFSTLANRGLGLCFGALKGAVVLWLLLSVTALLSQELHWLPFRLPWNFENARSYAFAQKYNAFSQEQWTKLLALEELAQLPPYAAQLLPMGDPSQLPPSVYEQLDKFKKFFDTPDIGKALKNKQFKSLLKDKELDKALKDEPFLKALKDFRNFSNTTSSPPKPSAP